MEFLKPYEIDALDIKTARKLYQSLRKNAKRRLQRIIKSGKSAYLESVPSIKPSKALTNDEIYAEIKETTRFLKNPYSSIRKITQFEKYMIEQLHASGYTFVNKNNIGKINFMLGKMRDNIPAEMWDSDEALEVLEQAERLNISAEDFEKNIDKFMEIDPETLADVKPIKTGREMKYKDLIKRIKK